jgi:hypothetical protein
VRALLVACALAGCDYSYRTYVEYEAPRTGLRIVEVADGVVKAGRDLAEGGHAVAVLCPTVPNGRALRIEINAFSIVVEGADGGVRALSIREPHIEEAVAREVAPASLSPDDAEIAESVRAIINASAGPKGTMVQGQTRALRFVRFERDTRAPTPTLATCRGR